MKYIIATWLLFVISNQAQAQAPVLNIHEFYYQLFKDYPESFIKMKKAKNAPIFKKSDLIMKMKENYWQYQVTINSDNNAGATTLNIIFKNSGKLTSGILKPSFTIPGIPESLFNTINFVTASDEQKRRLQENRNQTLGKLNSLKDSIHLMGLKCDALEDKKNCKITKHASETRLKWSPKIKNQESVDDSIKREIDVFKDSLEKKTEEEIEVFKSISLSENSKFYKLQNIRIAEVLDSINLDNENSPLFGDRSDIKITLPAENALERKAYNRALRWVQCRNRVLIGSTFAFAGNYRQALINSYQYDKLDKLDERNTNEIIQISTPVGIYLGGAWGNHQLVLSCNYQTFGFNIKPDSLGVDWKTGLPRLDSSNSQSYQKQRVLSFGLNYNYSAFRKGVSPFFTSGLYISIKKGGNIGTPSKSDEELFAIGAKAGLGISIKPCYLLDFRFYPVVYYNINSLRGTELKTRFYTVGLEAGMFFNFGHLRRS